MFSEVAEIARVAQRLGQFQQLLKTQLILILNFTGPMRLPILTTLDKSILISPVHWIVIYPVDIDGVI